MRMNDFPGGFSPMLVKELRQGMRTNLFTVAFILLQTVMILSLLAGLSDPGAAEIDAFFWFFIIMILLVVQPLRGFNALSAEYQLNTMDLIQLTRLNGWRITLGKWTALNAQTLLFLTGVLPYLVMRYFLGNVNFVVDLAALGMLGLGSALASAITIGCSVFRFFILRGIILIGFAMGFSGLFVGLQSTLFGSGLSGGSDLWQLGLIAISLVYGCFFFLSFGASRIAPLSENHSTRKRLVALAFTLLALGLSLAGIEEVAVSVVSGIILGLAAIDALTEPVPIYSRVLEPFRKNPLTRFAALFLAPGWISGIGFFFVCAVLWAVALHGDNFFADTSPGISGRIFRIGTFALDQGRVILFLSMINLLLFPLIIIHLFFGKQTSGNFTFSLYAFIQCILLFLTGMIMTLAGALARFEELIYTLAPLPSVLIFANGRGEADEFLYLILALATTFLGVAIPLLRHRATFRQFQHHLKNA
jgi:hypothetical protein